MRITEVVRVQNPMGGDYKSQLDRDRAAAAVRAQRQANRDAGKKGTLSKSRMDGMKASSAYTMRGGPKGVLPEGQDDLDTIRRLVRK